MSVRGPHGGFARWGTTTRHDSNAPIDAHQCFKVPKAQNEVGIDHLHAEASVDGLDDPTGADA